MTRHALLLLLTCCRHPTSEVTVGAAISLKEALDDVAATSSLHVRLVYGASGDLAAQMDHGAPFDLVAAAGEETHLSGIADEACTLAWNTLVLIKHRGSPDVTWTTLDKTPPSFRLAIGLTPQVPAGVYAEDALHRLGQWSAIAPKTVRGTNVRNVLDLVVRGEADAGVVYATDVRGKPDVDVIGEVPDFARPNVRYPLYLAHNASPASRAIATTLCSDDSKRRLVAHGFLDHPP
jgi:molybdate transport system substrate-binding protein